MIFRFVVLLAAVQLALGLGIPSPLVFHHSNEALTIAKGGQNPSSLPILYDSADPEAVRIAVETFADDIERVTGQRPAVHADGLPEDATAAVIVGTVNSTIIQRARRVAFHSSKEAVLDQEPLSDYSDDLNGKWESYDVRVVTSPFEALDEALVIAGSDRRGTIYALYSLSESMGVSPWYWWADVPTEKRDVVAFKREAVHAHGPPTVKYRGFFFNDEQPVLWNWAAEYFSTGDGAPPFQMGLYEKAFELLLRLKGNYIWPAMWESMFSVDGQGRAPTSPKPGPNQVLAQRMGVVMGTSHHEPMGRNQREWEAYGTGDWNFSSNTDTLREFWKYGTQRAQGCETLFTVGMRGDGDMPLDGAQAALLENITAEQQKILHNVYGNTSDIPQTWAMYKEVMGFYADGLRVPNDVIPLLSDDNWGNLMAVPLSDRKSGAGLYYHADYVGDPRSYKWINTVSLAKMWHQLDTARELGIDQIWILNVGDLKMLEMPLEYFMNIAYDAGRWPRTSLDKFLQLWAVRDFGADEPLAKDIAYAMARYSQLASRRKPELLDVDTYQLINSEMGRVVMEWYQLRTCSERIDAALSRQSADPELVSQRRQTFYQMLGVQIELTTNLHLMYLEAAQSRLYATQGRSQANVMARHALAKFDHDLDITRDFHQSQGGKWNHMLAQTHIGYQYWQAPVRSSSPPVYYVRDGEHSWNRGQRISTRFTVWNSAGAWPGDNMHNCAPGYNCPDPVLWPMSPWSTETQTVTIASGGPDVVTVSATPSEPWIDVVASGENYTLQPDGLTDVTFHVNLRRNAIPSSAINHTVYGNITLQSSDGSRAVVTVPLRHVENPPDDLRGTVESVGYVAINPAWAERLVGQGEYGWEVVPRYGFDVDGLSMFPATTSEFRAGQGPRAEYDFWAWSTGHVEVTLILGPGLNIILGRRVALAAQLDDGDLQTFYPVPESAPGTIPHDWEEVVARGFRTVSFNTTIDEPGKHTLSLYAMTTGIVVQRINVDFGAIRERGYTPLGAPMSLRKPLDDACMPDNIPFPL